MHAARTHEMHLYVQFEHVFIPFVVNVIAVMQTLDFDEFVSSLLYILVIKSRGTSLYNLILMSVYIFSMLNLNFSEYNIMELDGEVYQCDASGKAFHAPSEPHINFPQR